MSFIGIFTVLLLIQTIDAEVCQCEKMDLCLADMLKDGVQMIDTCRTDCFHKLGDDNEVNKNVRQCFFERDMVSFENAELIRLCSEPLTGRPCNILDDPIIEILKEADSLSPSSIDEIEQMEKIIEEDNPFEKKPMEFNPWSSMKRAKRSFVTSTNFSPQIYEFETCVVQCTNDKAKATNGFAAFGSAAYSRCATIMDCQLNPANITMQIQAARSCTNSIRMNIAEAYKQFCQCLSTSLGESYECDFNNRARHTRPITPRRIPTN